MIYTYTALLTPDQDGTYYCSVPDLPGCITTGNSLNEAIDMITDAASIWLVGAEDDHDPIPEPTPQEKLDHSERTILTLIRVDSIKYRASIDTHAVRKNVSLPAWMARLADEKGFNCSQILQESLLAKFG